ncbi:PREDICTED: non-specific lipid-transfer protein 1-like [Lupinus angustifolius]|uniref:non-specific lipid-transfer protein 1-like n=1 Tax=Lupinus angustifolius TaxID=3871 RepID=UPI00092E8E1B|nr:PREDICTED: non-specific lipid-transfer protein 1-like [Lupinus angustifolius]
MASMKFACIVIMCFAVVGAPIAQAISCGQVGNNLKPCLRYIMSFWGSVPGLCCDGVKTVMAHVQNTADKRATCNCLKSMVAKIGFVPWRAKSIPRECGVVLPYEISTSINCDNIN